MQLDHIITLAMEESDLTHLLHSLFLSSGQMPVGFVGRDRCPQE
jgi:hypothetical protein